MPEKKRDGAEKAGPWLVAVDSVPVMLWLADPHKQFSYVNKTWLEFTGRTLEQELGSGWLESIHAEDLGRSAAAYTAAFEAGLPFEMEFRLRRHDGEYRWILCRGVQWRNAEGSFVGYAGSAIDITDRKKNELRHQDLVNGINAIVWEFDVRSSRFTFVSPTAELLLGYPVSRWLEEPNFWQNHMHEEDRDWAVEYSDRQTRERRDHDFVYRMIAADGRAVWLRDMVTVGVENGEPVTLRGVMVDITDRKELERQLIHNAFHDDLTGLANRALFLERIDQVFKRARRLEDQTFAVLFLDVDFFKAVNDGLGHMAGDQFLKITASRLEKSVRDCDTVARFGGDEFAVLVDGLRHPQEAVEIAERVRAELRAPLHVSGQEILPTASIGVAIYRRSYSNVTDIIRDADSAMYQAKERGRDTCVVYDPAAQTRAGEPGIRKLIEPAGVGLEFHKIYSIEEKRIAGYAAAPRLADTRIAAGVDGLVGWKAFEEACGQAVLWHEKAPEQTLVICVKLTGQQVSEPDFCERLEDILITTGADPRRLKLELTETVFHEDVLLDRKLLKLHDLGVGLQIEDFGAGYFLLRRLRRYPIETVKTGLRMAGNRDLMEAVISLTLGLKLKVVAEGVETAAQLTALERLGCQYAQGRLFGLPLDARSVLQEIQSGSMEARGAFR